LKEEADAPNASVAALLEYGFMAFSKEKNYDEAERVLKKAVEREPKNLQALSNYALLLDNGKRLYAEADKYHKILLELDPVFALNPQVLPFEAEPYFRRSILFWEDPEKAEAWYKQYLESNPNDANMMMNYGHFLLAKKKDSTAAEEMLRKALEIDPHHERALLELASIETKKSNFGEAEKLYKQVLERNMDNHLASLNLGLLYWKKMKKLPEAQGLLKKSAESEIPRNLYYYAWYMDTHTSETSVPEVLYKAVMESGWVYSLAYCSYAKFLDLRLQKPAEAQTYYEKGANCHPYLPVTQLLYAEYLRRMNQPDQAEEYYKRSIKIRPTLDNLINYAFFMRRVRKNDTAAKALVERAKQIDPIKTEALTKSLFSPGGK
jgi:tetratricopeptide (TPR) repeat protein